MRLGAFGEEVCVLGIPVSTLATADTSVTLDMLDYSARMQPISCIYASKYRCSLCVATILPPCGRKRKEESVGTWLVLVSAVLAALATGVLLAYAVCVSMFTAFRIHVRNVATSTMRAQTTTARV